MALLLPHIRTEGGIQTRLERREYVGGARVVFVVPVRGFAWVLSVAEVGVRRYSRSS